ncbi:zinc ribbon domain-containing protein [Candidatus Halobonum tyrrellensis]|uniref:Uncharacterized protein n=1 Tax=Candidatus Halobonum tyrrellensis G22 TaxID=1324957 RepID=V4HDE7_9EURY|nr:zinc ribbon domain-containing protein [Candidatus Halobonum tyrrellensis]ESP88740.1 hypothetical protein K933_07813 [Candidatus Halobonum tyrrellensis G22]
MTPSTSDPGAAASPTHCSACGARLSPGDAFCSQCGTEADSAEPGDADRAWLRRRVQDLEVAGWETEADHGDRVVLRKRGFGSVLPHVGLFLVSGGVLNVVYAAYRYTVGAPRREVRADGTELSYPDRDGDLRGKLLLAGAVLAGGVASGAAALVAFLLTGSLTVGVALGAVALVALLVPMLLVLALPDGEERKSASTFGRERTVSEEPVRNPPEPCAACGDRVHTGVRRQFDDRLYAGGLPLRTYREGENVYCRACAADRSDGDGAGETGEGEREPDVERELERLMG